MDPADPNLGLWACMANTLPIEPYVVTLPYAVAFVEGIL